MAQLADLQFVGNKEALEDLEQALCTYQSIKAVREGFHYYGGIVGKLQSLEEKLDHVSQKVDKIEQDMYRIAHDVVQEHMEKTSHAACNVSTDEQFMIPLIRHEAKDVAEAVFAARLNNLHISFEGAD